MNILAFAPFVPTLGGSVLLAWLLTLVIIVGTVVCIVWLVTKIIGRPQMPSWAASIIWIVVAIGLIVFLFNALGIHLP